MQTTDPDPSPPLTLVLDQGSNSSRLGVFSSSGQLIHLDSIELSTHSPAANQYEQDAGEILGSLQTLLQRLPRTMAGKISAAGLCTQRSTLVAWHRFSGEALSPAISWRDLRGHEQVDSLKASAPLVRGISGLPLSAHYSASKIHWLLQHNSRVQQAANEGQLCIAPLASFLLFHLLNEKPCVIDHSNAQRSQLFDIQMLQWSDTLLELFGIDPPVLPDCKPVIDHYGTLKGGDIPLLAVCGDQNAALHACPQLEPNGALVNIGTGAFILSPLGEASDGPEPRLLRTIAHSHPRTVKYITEGTVNGAGAALSWAEKSDPCGPLFQQLPDWLEQTDSPPLFINTIAGLGSPWWCDGGPAEFIGTPAPTRAERYTAIIESIVFLIFNNLQQLESLPRQIFISGGLSRLDGLCQKLANLSQARILRFNDPEASARGCAWLARQYSTQGALACQLKDFSAGFDCRPDSALISRFQLFSKELQKRCNRG